MKTQQLKRWVFYFVYKGVNPMRVGESMNAQYYVYYSTHKVITCVLSSA